MAAQSFPFWRFSTRVYRRPRVAELLVRLQDEAGFDVNLVLFGIFAATRSEGSLAPGLVGRAADMARVWSFPVVRPLRQARRALKSSSFGVDDARETLRQRLLKLEQDAEQMLQRALSKLVPDGEVKAPKATTAETNVLALQRAIGALVGPRTRTEVKTLVALCLGRGDRSTSPRPNVSSPARQTRRGPERARPTDRSGPGSTAARRRRRARAAR